MHGVYSCMNKMKFISIFIEIHMIFFFFCYRTSWHHRWRCYWWYNSIGNSSSLYSTFGILSEGLPLLGLDCTTKCELSLFFVIIIMKKYYFKVFAVCLKSNSCCEMQNVNNFADCVMYKIISGFTFHH